MSDDSERTFISGNPNPNKYGFSLRACNGSVPDQAQIAQAAEIMKREAFYEDHNGYECEIIAATVHPDRQQIVYVESRAKGDQQYVDIAIKIHFVDRQGQDNAVDIRSYNPYFGCDVVLLEWFNDDVALLVYREKHWTFAYRIGDQWPPEYVKIEDRWQINGDVLSYMKFQAEIVQRVQIPSLETLPSISVEEAEKSGELPPDPYGR